MRSFTTRIQHAWSAFNGRDHPYQKVDDPPYYSQSVRSQFTARGSERSIVRAIYNRIALDAASILIKHVRLDENGRYASTMESNLNEALTLSPNLDQTSRAFFQEAYYNMLEDGKVALIPTFTDISPLTNSDALDIMEMRVGIPRKFYHDSVEVEWFNTKTARYETLIYPKKHIAIIQNPFYETMNMENTYFQRLVKTLAKLDSINEKAASGKLDLIIQVPYTSKTDLQRQRAEARRQQLEDQLKNSYLGIAYADATEKITQLNRPIENNLLSQVEYLSNEVFSQLGMTMEILNGSANEETMLNYTNRIIEPIVSAFVDEMKRKFLTKTARSQHQSIMYFRDMFKLAPVKSLAESLEKLKAAELISANEGRSIIGFVPVQDERADQLINSNINPIGTEEGPMNTMDPESIDQDALAEEYNSQMHDLDELDTQLDEYDKLDHSLDGIPDTYSDPIFEKFDQALEHYASKYYDPVKAHEYYEQHKQLKGNNSQKVAKDNFKDKVFSTRGKEAVTYVKKQLSEEHASNVQAARDKAKQDIERHKNEMASMIAQLKILAGGASGKENSAKRKAVQVRVARLREKNNEAREALNRSIKSTIDALKNDYNVKLNEELTKIYSSASFYEEKKTKSKTSKADSSSSK